MKSSIRIEAPPESPASQRTLKTRGLTGAQALLLLLERMGVEAIFASPGSEWASVWEELARLKEEGGKSPQYFSSRHEETAVSMASGYSKASGKLPAVLLHTTVGSLHGAMALRAAFHERIPMVVFAGETVAFGEEETLDPGEQWLRHLADVGGPSRLVEPFVKWSAQVDREAILPSMIQRACQLAMESPRGPVFLSCPMEVFFERLSRDTAAAALPSPSVAGPQEILKLTEMLVDSKNPVIVTECLGRDLGAVDQLVSLAEVLGAPVVETRSAGYVNFPRSHPLHGGFQPKEYLSEADLILLLATVSPWHPASLPLSEGTKMVVLDENPLRQELPYWGYPVDLCLGGEVKGSLGLLLDSLSQRAAGGRLDQDRSQVWHRRIEQRRQGHEDEATSLQDQCPIDVQWLVHELNQVLPADAIIVEETITHRLMIQRGLDRLGPGSFFSGCTGGLGTGLGTALGVKTAAPNRPVLALMGDGSFNYNPVVSAFGFAQEYQIPILVLLFNNQGYLTMKQDLKRYHPEGWAVRTNTFVGTSIRPTPDYPALARAFGGFAETVEDPRRIQETVQRGLEASESGQLVLLDIRLQPVN